jgi:hypothetical protein
MLKSFCYLCQKITNNNTSNSLNLISKSRGIVRKFHYSSIKLDNNNDDNDSRFNPDYDNRLRSDQKQRHGVKLYPGYQTSMEEMNEKKFLEKQNNQNLGNNSLNIDLKSKTFHIFSLNKIY